jgi:imidazolonepropionase-like amidohydrolase
MDRLMIFLISLFLVLSLLTNCNKSQNPIVEDNGEGTIAITNGILIDGTGVQPVLDAIILIKNENIISIGTSSTLEIPLEAIVIDVQGSYILPGFMNAHVHYAYNESNLKE